MADGRWRDARNVRECARLDRGHVEVGDVATTPYQRRKNASTRSMAAAIETVANQ
jgi:hypothetical protein